MKNSFTLLSTLLLAPLAALHTAEAPKPAVKVTQELLNSIHVTPKLIFDPFPAYAEKYLPFAMAASMESTHKGRLWTCWAGGQDGPNAYLLASYSDDQGKSWRDPVFVIDPQAHGLKERRHLRPLRPQPRQRRRDPLRPLPRGGRPGRQACEQGRGAEEPCEEQGARQEPRRNGQLTLSFVLHHETRPHNLPCSRFLRTPDGRKLGA